MCLIISRPSGIPIPAAFLSNGQSRNPDGWGVMWASKGKIRIAKGIDPGSFPAAIKAAGKNPLHVHFRWATHGSKGKENCHPFPILGGQYALMHNGVIGSVSIREKDRSDTWHFAHDVLAPILDLWPHDAFDSPALVRMLGSIVGHDNKLVILRADGACIHVNRNAGVERDGVWLSNSYSVEPKVLATYQGTFWNRTEPARAPANDWANWRNWGPSCDESEDTELVEVKASSNDDERECAPPMPRDLLDLEYYTRDEIALLCDEEPAAMADIIAEFLEDNARYLR